MVIPTEGVTDVAKAIQLALAPVFLLTGIAGMLNVMAGRLARIMDRGRALASDWDTLPIADQPGVTTELRYLDLRRHYTSIAIAGCTVAALMVCLVIASLFLEVMLGAQLRWLIGGLFTASTLSLVVGLAYFLREVHLATKTIRIPIAAEDKEA